MNRTLEEMAAALFKSWFVDFDPVHAKAEGRRPFGMDDATAALFPDRFVETEEGPVPEGWETMSLSDFMEINPKRILTTGIEASYIPMTAAPTSGHAPSVTETRAKGSGATFVNGDTLLAKITPCLENGKTVYVDCLDDGEVGWGSTEFIVLRPRYPWPEVFGYVLARYPDFRAHAIKSMTGTSGRQRVQLDDLKQYEHVLPTNDALPLAFGRLITPFVGLAGQNARESKTLADLRDTLLPKLLSGEIRLEQAEKAVEEAV
jgi:type I restriction enzyme S subunit